MLLLLPVVVGFRRHQLSMMFVFGIVLRHCVSIRTKSASLVLALVLMLKVQVLVK